MVSITASETTIAVEGDCFEGVGIVDNLMCCAVKLVAMKKNEISKILEKKWHLIKSSIDSGRARKYTREQFYFGHSSGWSSFPKKQNPRGSK